MPSPGMIDRRRDEELDKVGATSGIGEPSAHCG
jgi:hypothetical protein